MMWFWLIDSAICSGINKERHPFGHPIFHRACGTGNLIAQMDANAVDVSGCEEIPDVNG